MKLRCWSVVNSKSWQLCDFSDLWSKLIALHLHYIFFQDIQDTVHIFYQCKIDKNQCGLNMADAVTLIHTSVSLCQI